MTQPQGPPISQISPIPRKFWAWFYREDPWWLAYVPSVDSVTHGKDLAEAEFMAADLVSGFVRTKWDWGESIDYWPKPEQVRLHADTGTLDGHWREIEIPQACWLSLRIARQRMLLGKTPAEVAAEVGVSEATYLRWEAPWTFNPPWKRLELIGQALGLNFKVEVTGPAGCKP